LRVRQILTLLGFVATAGIPAARCLRSSKALGLSGLAAQHLLIAAVFVVGVYRQIAASVTIVAVLREGRAALLLEASHGVIVGALRKEVSLFVARCARNFCAVCAQATSFPYLKIQT